MTISPLEALTALGDEEVVFRQDPDSGYVAILAAGWG